MAQLASQNMMLIIAEAILRLILIRRKCPYNACHKIELMPSLWFIKLLPIFTKTIEEKLPIKTVVPISPDKRREYPAQ